ncbi:hypothetical protein SELMODRAFT_95641, partial [Selaginella moellendorffii]
FAEALLLFRRMELDGVKPSPVTCVTVLASFTVRRLLPQARKFHARITALGLESNVIVGTEVITMYEKCGSLRDSRLVFERMPQKNLVTWTTLISSYAHGHGREAMEIFERLLAHGGLEPDAVACVSALDACSSMASLEQGRKVHRIVVSRGFESNTVFASNEALCHSLMTMYSKLGRVESVREIFEKMASKNVISWTYIVSAHAQAGDLEMTLSLFAIMQLEGVAPDSIAFVSVLSSCSHGGLLESFPMILRCTTRFFPVRSTTAALWTLWDGAGSLTTWRSLWRSCR